MRMRIYYTFTHMNIVSGKVATTKRMDMMTSSQPKHPRLPEFLSVGRVDNTLLASTGTKTNHFCMFAHFQCHIKVGVLS